MDNGGNDVFWGGLAAVSGVVAGFVLQEVATQVRRRQAARNTLHALWLEIAEAEVLLRFYLDRGIFPAPEEIDLSFPTLTGRADDLRVGLGYHGLNYCARMLGSGNRRVGATLRRLAEAQILNVPIAPEVVEMAQQSAKTFHTDMLSAGRYVDASQRLTLGFWMRHPRRAHRARAVVRSTVRAEVEREDGFRQAGLPRVD